MTATTGNSLELLDIYRVMKYLPHRYPFLLIDRVTHYISGESLTALKNVTVNEPFFPGHFPHRPIMPGVLILESMAQATGILAIITADRFLDDKSLYYFVGVDNARFKQPVIPGDQLIVEVKLLRTMRSLWKFSCEAKVENKLVASAEIMCAEKEFEL